jgi:predicted metal-dependent HD superfamily phosphohydrolase
VDLVDRWPLPAGTDERDALLAAYADPARGYHDTRHLTEVLDRLDELADAGEPFDRRTVALAAWFHDGVHDGAPDDEERSAAWAEDALRGLVPDDVVADVARLVRMTAEHRPDDADADGCALSDADLAILAADEARYADYVATVRQEYAQVPDAAFRSGRATVLQALADKPHLFHTSHARAHWEPAARANLAVELRALSPGGPT